MSRSLPIYVQGRKTRKLCTPIQRQIPLRSSPDPGSVAVPTGHSRRRYHHWPIKELGLCPSAVSLTRSFLEKEVIVVLRFLRARPHYIRASRYDASAWHVCTSCYYGFAYTRLIGVRPSCGSPSSPSPPRSASFTACRLMDSDGCVRTHYRSCSKMVLGQTSKR
jgi:hypothetical protein